VAIQPSSIDLAGALVGIGPAEKDDAVAIGGRVISTASTVGDTTCADGEQNAAKRVNQSIEGNQPDLGSGCYAFVMHFGRLEGGKVV
jgi:hypothetical protein